jgi:glycerate 2-kinase
MNIIIACDSFKDALSASKVCAALAKGIAETNNTCLITAVPLADGGEGTLDAIAKNIAAEYIETEVLDPLFRPIKAKYLWQKNTKTAYIEMAKASGLELLNMAERNPLLTSTYGTGQLIKHALTYKPTKIILFVGGSATTDGGIGMAEALGFSFYDIKNAKLITTGQNLISIKKINDHNLTDFNTTEIIVATDVTNEFCGHNGAAQLDEGLIHLNEIFKNTKNIDLQKITGSGAAGGIAGGAVGFLGAKIMSGADLIIEICDIEKKLQNADILITGEGRIDNQTWHGKLISRLNNVAQKLKVKTILVGGAIEDLDEILINQNLILVTSIINKPMTLKEAIKNTELLLINEGKIIGKMLKNYSRN